MKKSHVWWTSWNFYFLIQCCQKLLQQCQTFNCGGCDSLLTEHLLICLLLIYLMIIMEGQLINIKAVGDTLNETHMSIYLFGYSLNPMVWKILKFFRRFQSVKEFARIYSTCKEFQWWQTFTLILHHCLTCMESENVQIMLQKWKLLILYTLWHRQEASTLSGVQTLHRVTLLKMGVSLLTFLSISQTWLTISSQLWVINGITSPHQCPKIELLSPHVSGIIIAH